MFLLAALASTGPDPASIVLGEPLSPFAVPIRTIETPSDGAVVELCNTVNLTATPTNFPFFDNLIDVSGCRLSGTEVHGIPLTELVNNLARETPTEYWAAPAGLIVHGMRTGSTALANMVGSHPDVIVLKEPAALTDVLLAALPLEPDGPVSPKDEGAALRETIHASVTAANALVPEYSRVPLALVTLEHPASHAPLPRTAKGKEEAGRAEGLTGRRAG